MATWLYRINKINNSKPPKIGEALPKITILRAKNNVIEISGTIMFYSGRKKPTEVEVLLERKPVSKCSLVKFAQAQKQALLSLALPRQTGLQSKKLKHLKLAVMPFNLNWLEIKSKAGFPRPWLNFVLPNNLKLSTIKSANLFALS